MRYRSNLLFFSVFLLTMLANGWDAWDDLAHHGASGHLTLNILLMVLSFVGLLAVWQQFVQRGIELASAKASLTVAQTSLGKTEVQAAKLMGELSGIIHRQFDVWQLSDAEKEVALLLLKGLSLEEIAVIRGRAEKTVRQQASAVYNKAGIAGRHALSAYFFEDLLGK
jgi:DNA-binding CsgD family transcriptional regulator